MASIVVENVEIPRGEWSLKGRIYRTGDTPNPSVILCHGYPGDTKQMDLAEELAFNGYNVLIFYYMGAWGSGGTYRFRNLTPSTRAALEWMIQQPYVDETKIALISHSMGAVPLTNLMAEDHRIKTAVLMSPASDLKKWMSQEVLDTVFPIFREMGEGKLATGDQVEYKRDMMWAAQHMNPIEKVRKIDAPLLVVVGSGDQVTKPESCRLVYEYANDPKEWVLVEGADHGFSEHRIQVQKIILQWLRDNL